MADDLVIAASARKHGVSDEDIRHAYQHPIRVFELDEARKRPPGWTREKHYQHPIRVFELDEGFTMIIGANHAAIIYEIGVSTVSRPPSSCMPCRPATSS